MVHVALCQVRCSLSSRPAPIGCSFVPLLARAHDLAESPQARDAVDQRAWRDRSGAPVERGRRMSRSIISIPMRCGGAGTGHWRARPRRSRTTATVSSASPSASAANASSCRRHARRPAAVPEPTGSRPPRRAPPRSTSGRLRSFYAAWCDAEGELSTGATRPSGSRGPRCARDAGFEVATERSTTAGCSPASVPRRRWPAGATQRSSPCCGERGCVAAALLGARHRSRAPRSRRRRAPCRSARRRTGHRAAMHARSTLTRSHLLDRWLRRRAYDDRAAVPGRSAAGG